MPYIEDVLIETGDAVFDPATDLYEIFSLDGTQPGGGDSFSSDAAEAVLVYKLDWKKRRSFTRWLLGFSYADYGYPYRLRRENPQNHPAYPKLYASTVSFSSFSPRANDEGTGTPEINSPNYPSLFFNPGGIEIQGYYGLCYATVRFNRPNYDIFVDEYIGDISAPLTDPAAELWRNQVSLPSSSVELLTAEGGQAQFVWSETSAAPPGGVPGPAVDTPVFNNFAIRIARTVITIDLFGWPENYLSEDNLYVPYYGRLYSCAGLVNSTKFLGYSAGTLLCDPPQIVRRFQYPVSTSDGVGAFFGLDIRLTFKYFEPTNLGVEDTDPDDDDKARGWRCYLYAPNQKWYGIQRQDTTDNKLKWTLQEADFNNMLRHWADPTET